MARRLRDRVEPRVFLSPTGFVPAIFLIESENSQRTLSRSSRMEPDREGVNANREGIVR